MKLIKERVDAPRLEWLRPNWPPKRTPSRRPVGPASLVNFAPITPCWEETQRNEAQALDKWVDGNLGVRLLAGWQAADVEAKAVGLLTRRDPEERRGHPIFGARLSNCFPAAHEPGVKRFPAGGSGIESTMRKIVFLESFACQEIGHRR
jgi:hypothetical protein